MGFRCGATAIAVALLGACTHSAPQAQWEAVYTSPAGAPGALLSAWAASGTDVWVVGGAAPSAPIVQHYDGTTWTKKSPSVTVNLWWVKGFDDGTVFLSGDGGTILRYHPSSDSFEQFTTPGNLTVFGMWGATPDDVWAVGGAQTGGGFVWRFNGTAWSEVTGLPADVTNGFCFKVNGTDANNVWMSGSNGTTMHWNGQTLMVEPITALQQQQTPLTSIAVNSKLAVTVGGTSDGALFENPGSGWTQAVPSGGNVLTGVAVSETDAYAVGEAGTILHRNGDGSWSTEPGVPTGQNLHADFIDPSGGVWAVGGKFDSSVTTDAVLLHKGAALNGVFQP